VLLEHQNDYETPSWQETATTLSQLDAFKLIDPMQIQVKITEMIDAGSRYRNLEQHLGIGVSLVLGMDPTETTWTKLLPKSGPKFDDVMKHLKSTELPNLAVRYRILREIVVGHQLGTFRAIQQRMFETNLSSPERVPYPSPENDEMYLMGRWST